MRRHGVPIALKLRRVALVLAAFAGAASGATTALPDPKQYPSLSALLVWLRSDAKDAKTCSAQVAMTLSSRAAYEKSGSDAAAVKSIAAALVERHKTEPSQAQKLATAYVRTAVLFAPLPADAAGLAVAELCRSALARGDRPFADEALQTRLVAEAKKCLSVGFVERPNNPAPLDCVVRTFNRRP